MENFFRNNNDEMTIVVNSDVYKHIYDSDGLTAPRMFISGSLNNRRFVINFFLKPFFSVKFI